MANNAHKGRVDTIGRFVVYPLDKSTAIRYVRVLAELADTIPLVHYTEQDILAESKQDRTFYGKWDHSLIVFDAKKPVAFIIGYEREAEDNSCYSENSIYISELAVDQEYRKQGIGRELVKVFLRYNPKLLYLEGGPVYTVQTNSAPWNKPVRKLYQSLGFEPAGTRKYENRTDVVLKKGPESGV